MVSERVIIFVLEIVIQRFVTVYHDDDHGYNLVSLKI